MAVTEIHHRYSRGNNDPNEKIYETADLTVTVIVNTDECSGDVRNCTGAVSARLRYKAVSRTNDPMFPQGTTYSLVHLPQGPGGPIGNSQNLQLNPQNPAAPATGAGAELVAEIDLQLQIPCAWGFEFGSAVIASHPPGGQPAVNAPLQVIVFVIAIANCGVLMGGGSITLERPIPGRVPTPLRDVTAGEQSYPAFPGDPR